MTTRLATFERLAASSDVAESDFLALIYYGISSVDNVAFKYPDTSDWIELLRAKILPVSAYKEGECSVITFPRQGFFNWTQFKDSGDCAASCKSYAQCKILVLKEAEKEVDASEVKKVNENVEELRSETGVREGQRNR